MSQVKTNSWMRDDGVVNAPQIFDDVNNDDIVEFAVRQVPKKVGPGEDDYILVDKVYEKSRVNRKDYINSFRDDVGILNILKKCSLANKDLSDHPFSVNESFIDLTKAPKDIFEALDSTIKAHDDFKKLDPHLTKKRSFEDFMKEINKDEFDTYINDLVEKKTKKQVVSEVKEDK